MRNLRFRLGLVIQRHVVIQRADAVTPVIHAHGLRTCQRMRGNRPQKNADIGDVVASTLRGNAAHIYAMRHGIKGAADAFQRLPMPQVRRVVIIGTPMIHVLGGRQRLKEFHCTRIPAGDIASQLLQHSRRPFTSTQRNGVRHFGAWTTHAQGITIQGAIAD